MELPNRKSIRNKSHDYSKGGCYFITTNTRGSLCLFGKVNSGGVILNELGKAVQRFWLEIPTHFGNVEIDEFVVMPNHIHGILHIDCRVRICPSSDGTVMTCQFFDGTVMTCPDRTVYATCPYLTNQTYTPNHFGAQRKGSLGIIIGQFKAAVTRWAKENGQGGVFDWLPRYNDRIVRNNEELIAIRNYIRNNPGKWWDKYGDELLL
jgi:putative transposase